MSKINPVVKGTSRIDECTAGGFGTKAAKQNNVALLKRITLANLLWEDIAYVDGLSVAEEMKRLIPLCPAEEVYNIALSARRDSKLRHTPLFIAVEMCKHESTRQYVHKLLPQIITRADMLTDFLAIYWKDGKCPLANCVKRGLAEAFHNFNEYQFAKYDRDATIKLRDVMFLVHPVPTTDTERDLFKKIADRTLATPETWEVLLSAGNDKKETWTKLITENKIGGLAMLRNLRNMASANVSNGIIEEGLSKLHKSMLMPLDYLKAYTNTPQYGRWIENAMIESYKSLPKLKGKTLLILDMSGSMMANVSRKSQFTRKDCAIAMAMLAINQCEDCTLVLTAGDDGVRIHKSMILDNPSIGFGLNDQIKSFNNLLGCGGIFTRQCLEWCKERAGSDFDRIIVFSDSQDCDYPNARIPNPFGKYNYICDVSSERHGINFQGKWTAEISGFSDHFLQYIAAYEGIQNMFDE